jgi:hypothetical protein
MPSRAERGAATVEHAALALLVALLLGVAAAVVAADPPERAARELAGAIARKLRCAPALPGPCWRDPLTTAYGRPLAGLVRALAPKPEARVGPGGVPLLPVHFRHCRSQSCARPGTRPELTASNRRVTVFVSVRDLRRRGRGVVIDYWEYRPTLGWALQRVRATAADVARHARTPLLETAHPRLVPLEALAGRNHVRFAPGEEPPWRWRVPSVS